MPCPFYTRSRYLGRGLLGGAECDAECLAELPTPQQSLGLQLQLPHPLARDLKLVAKLGKCHWILSIKAVTVHQHIPEPLRKPIYGFLHLRALHLAQDCVRRVRGTLVLDELPKL